MYVSTKALSLIHSTAHQTKPNHMHMDVRTGRKTNAEKCSKLLNLDAIATIQRDFERIPMDKGARQS